MQIWIDIEDASGNKYGPGPIKSATGWTSTRRLDAAGTFSFTMLAADPMAAEVQNKRYARCWRAGDDITNPRDHMEEMGAGIIEQINLRVSAGGLTMLEVSGIDILSELGNISVGDLDLFTDTVRAPQSVVLIPPEADPALPTVIWPANGGVIDLDIDPGPYYLYISDQDEFFQLYLGISSGNSKVAELKAQYFNEEADPAGWEYLPLVSNGTVVAGKPFATSGTIEFELPVGWGKATYGKYDVRLFCDNVNLSPVTFSSFSVTVRSSTTTALVDVMNLAPAGWSFDPAGLTATSTPVYRQMAGESVLATLVALAEQTGEHFLLSPVGRRIWWIGPVATVEQIAARSSGLRAYGPADPGADPQDDVFYITGLERMQDSYPLYTSIIPHGAGVGNERITLADATDLAPSGYTLGTNYLRRNAAVTQFGRIDKIADYPDIAPLDNSSSARSTAGNMLLQRAYEDLKRGSYLQNAYTLSLVPSRYRIYPGQTIDVRYDEWEDGYHSVAINETLWVLEATYSITAEGDMLTMALIVATVDSYPQADDGRMASEVVISSISRAAVIPESGLTDANNGEPSSIKIRNGKVTQVTRKAAVFPCPDGDYPEDDLVYAANIRQIKVRDGRITYIFIDYN